VAPSAERANRRWPSLTLLLATACAGASASPPPTCAEQQSSSGPAVPAVSAKPAPPTGHAASASCQAEADYTSCGSEQDPARCIRGACLKLDACVDWCGQQLAIELATDLSTLFPHCSGPRARNCRWKVLSFEHPLVKKATARSEACLVDCGYSPLTLPSNAL
jgi:hypothetical protein